VAISPLIADYLTHHVPFISAPYNEGSCRYVVQDCAGCYELKD